ncbi:MAG: acylneuraminate cytidylyltransferase family protein [Thaumarchaeota archaeon]|nr:acylneuraminate cytidylyltransferase family protein [Nitrososphaerota archaeon]
MQILAIIPARGGSKGIRNKNIRILGGKPLIAHTIIAAKKSKYINKVIVNTDDKKISNISRSYGANVPFLRPRKLARDNSSTIEVVKHTLEFLRNNESYVPDIIVILQPTSPFRTVKLIDSSIEKLKKTDASCVLTVTKIIKHPFSSFLLKGNTLKPFKRNFSNYDQRQKYPALYFPTGEVYTFWYKTLENHGSIYGKKIKPIIINAETAIDIDTPFDLFISEMISKYWSKYKRRFD